ncbi:uncharacterized protein LOC129769629 [Toxorhynchites rutilus septentrionalis]|uniref:uncharacterized protein LOC129769629 n=1 Tax=Toxorhynchites rutilus septentrionalis TaxID=329112 RepID=UPI00247A7977|nr:uncharacterized protein LOC129769629 [Toxorhynchites rutilus septentrionalis]XP_055627986.1 uncharacterized protein LOC129769629 [Toxorhynchites rutilus septentrionalis]
MNNDTKIQQTRKSHNGCRQDILAWAQSNFVDSMKILQSRPRQSISRRMLIKNNVENATDPPKMQQQHKCNNSTNQPNSRVIHPNVSFSTQSIMQNALRRKKLQNQRKALCDQNSRIAAATALINNGEPDTVVQQFVQSIRLNMQRSFLVLSQTAYRPVTNILMVHISLQSRLQEQLLSVTQKLCQQKRGPMSTRTS